MKTRVLESRVNTYLGSLFILSFGLFALTIGFKIENMANPITNAIAQQEAAVAQ